MAQSWAIGSALSYLYAHSPFVKPAAHEHLYFPTGIDESDVDSVHVAPFTHGLLAHSFVIRSHVPPSAMLHSAVYWAMNEYAHVPLAKPATHAHEKASAEMALPSQVLACESVQPAPFWHGDDTHSSMSISQCPPRVTLHCFVYRLVYASDFLSQPAAHTPFAKPATHAHEYESTGGRPFDFGSHAVPFGKLLGLHEDCVHVAPFLHGLLAHSSMSRHVLPSPLQPR